MMHGEGILLKAQSGREDSTFRGNFNSLRKAANERAMRDFGVLLDPLLR
jgi:hypothetical protein